MKPLLAGRVRHRRHGPGAPLPCWEPWAHNLVCFGALDLIGGLLVRRPGLRGITWLAVGTGDPAWDAEPPPPDRSRTRLEQEVLRVPLVPGRSLSYDAVAGAVDVRVSLPGRLLAAHTLRELGLFGGRASARPGSGLLLNHKPHEPIELGVADELERQIRLELPAGLLPGARDVVGGLLARRAGFSGLHSAAVGTDGSSPQDPPAALLAEVLRTPLQGRDLRYDATRHAVVAELTMGPGEGPTGIAEAGLFGGPDGTDDGPRGLLVDRQVFPAVDRRTPVGIRRRFELSLVTADEVPVPELSGRTLAEARALLGRAELLMGSSSEVDGGGAPVGTVVGQDPVAGTAVAEGTPVHLRIAAVETVVVPEVLGLPVTRATAALRRAGLTVPSPRDRPSDAPPGTVLTALPPPGARVPVGSAVALTTAQRRRAPVPDVRGRTVTGARALLESAGFALQKPPYETVQSGSTAGGVVEQDPPGGTVTPLGRAVTVVVATPWSAEIPDVRGLALPEAAGALRLAAAPLLASLDLPPVPPGLALGGTTRRPAEEGEAVDTVVEQVPAPGESAQLYATVAVVVATPSALVVPDLLGLDQGAAAAALAAAGLTLGAVSRRVSENPTGLVVDQDPDAGRAWPSGGRIAVTISSPVLVVVPELQGMDRAAAQEALTARDLTMGEVGAELVPDGRRPGSVLRQVPAPGVRAPRGSAVGLVVVAGVPDVVGLRSEVAEATLISRGLTAAISSQPSDVRPGIVLAQVPSPGSPASPGMTVELTVAVQLPVEVPDVIGLPLAEATRAIDRLGLVLGVVRSDFDDDVPEGAVLALDPPAGTLLQRGNGVACLLSLGRLVLVGVPALRGHDVAAATQLCREVGLTLRLVSEEPAQGTAAGTVLRQSPDAGTQARPGTVVEVVVASRDTSVVLPDVRNRPLAEAVQILRLSGLTPERSGSQLSVAVSEGRVLSQDPLPGHRVPAGTTVRLVVAEAAALVPGVVGTSLDVATDMLGNAGLQVQATFRPGGIPDRVVGQHPAKGTLIALGSTVNVTVTLGRIFFPPDIDRPTRPIDVSPRPFEPNPLRPFRPEP